MSSLLVNNPIADSNSYTVSLMDYLQRERSFVQPKEGFYFYLEMVDDNGTPQNLVTSDSQTIRGLRFSVGPNSVSVNMSKIINRQQSMVSWIEDHWGEELDTISLQGSTLSFIGGGNSQRDVNTRTVNGYIKNQGGSDEAISRLSGPYDLGIGLTTRYRRDTVPYQEFKRLINIMHHQGCKYDNLGFVSERYFLQLSYDYASYTGYIESIDTIEDAASPFRFTYSMTFKAEKTIYSFLK